MPSQKVRLELYASKLKNVAGIGKGTSDPFAVVTQLASDPREQPKVLGKTEVIKNSLSPKWTEHFDLDYEIGRLTRINITLFDEVRKGNNKQMGSAMFEVGEVLGSRGNTKAKKLRRGGTVFVRITNAPASSAGTLHLKLRGIKLKNVDGLFGKSDPFFELNAQVNVAGSNTWQTIYRSRQIDNDLNPKWEKCTVDINRLCAGDMNRPIMISVWDWEKNGKHQNMGSFELNMNSLLASVTAGADGNPKSVDMKQSFCLLRRGKEMGKILVAEARVDGATSSTGAAPAGAASSAATAQVGNVPAFGNALDNPPPSFSGAAAAVTAASTMSSFASAMPAPQNTAVAPSVPPSVPAASAPFIPGALPPPMVPPSMTPAISKPTFVDYVSGGCELEMTVAIDYTGSNGDPRRPGTLHYIHPNGELNDYEKALTAIGSIIDRYDSDHKYPVFGFGAKYGGVIQHCFQVGPKAELDGIGAIVEAYRNVFRTGLTMSGPTVFSECINIAAASARSRQEEARRWGQQAYKVLLILTDGAVSDIDDTRRALDAASDAPLSVVIIGIGNADFSAMQFLDDFQAGVGGTGRDICQFVEFSKYKHDKSLLTRETLDEIPDQLVDYFHSRGIKPLPPSSLNDSFCASEASEDEIDLNLAFSPEGEINLENYDNAVYDDSKYDTIAAYPQPAVPSSSQPFIPPQTSAPSQPYTPNPPPPLAYSAAPAPAGPPVFHVQVPPGMGPGSQLQVKNPKTGQDLIVTIPQGVANGGVFAVQY